MVLEDKLGSDKALEQFKKVVDKYYAGHEVQIVGSKSDILDFTWHICTWFHCCNICSGISNYQGWPMFYLYKVSVRIFLVHMAVLWLASSLHHMTVTSNFLPSCNISFSSCYSSWISSKQQTISTVQAFSAWLRIITQMSQGTYHF